MLKLATASALILALGAAAAPSKPAPAPNPVNSVKCFAIAFGNAKSYSESAFVDLGVDLAAHTCGEKTTQTLTVQYTKIATAVAKAIAATYVECTTVGVNVYGEAQAYAHSKATAEARAEALGAGWGSIETCYGCKAAAELLVKSSKEIFASAMAESHSQLKAYGAADGRAKFTYAGEVVKSIEAKVAKAFASVSIEVKAAVDAEKGKENCGVKIQGCTAAGNTGGCCKLSVESASTSVSTDALAEAGAGAQAIAYSCGEDHSEAEASAFASAIATAFAKAVSSADGYCRSKDGSSACAWGSTSVSAFAYAQAKAVATTWASAANGCNCKIDVDVVTKAFQEIFASAHSEVSAEICVENQGLAGVDVLAVAYEKKMATATALAIVRAYQAKDVCGTSQVACAETGNAYNKEFGCCEIKVDNYPQDLSKDGIAEAVALAGAYTCAEDEEVDAKAQVFAKAIAKAVARAVIEIEKYCVSSKKAGFCSLIDGSITAHAQALAKAFASAWAGTPSGCACEISVEAVAQVMTPIFATATKNVHQEKCKYGEAFTVTYDVLEKVVEKEVAAIATAVATLKSNGKNCEGSAGAGAGTTKKTAATALPPAQTATQTQKVR